ncbi:peptidoglycan-binding protein [Streptomyces sp. CA-288835]|uniref:peptidoglycan-binding protein n=1 Tax=Streptomyces sp. CA-288835 TaxID=3240069 RepID=UPI003D940455
MRAMTRTLVSVATAVGIAAGGVAAAGTAFAAPAQDTRTVASAEAAAYDNLGLNEQQASNIQRWLSVSVDGKLGVESWKEYQTFLQDNYGYDGEIDGDPGPKTVTAIQHQLHSGWGYEGPVDGNPNAPGFQDAFRYFADRIMS